MLEHNERLLIAPLVKVGHPFPKLRAEIQRIQFQRLPALLAGLVEEPEVDINHRQLLVGVREAGVDRQRVPQIFHRELMVKSVPGTPQKPAASQKSPPASPRQLPGRIN